MGEGEECNELGGDSDSKSCVPTVLFAPRDISKPPNFFADLAKRDRSFGEPFYYYQLFEGINHGLLVLGSLFVLYAGRGNDATTFFGTGMFGKFAKFCVIFLYEIGIVAELLLYGPQYFWMLTLNMRNA